MKRRVSIFFLTVMQDAAPVLVMVIAVAQAAQEQVTLVPGCITLLSFSSSNCLGAHVPPTALPISEGYIFSQRDHKTSMSASYRVRHAVKEDVAVMVAFQMAMALETEGLKLDEATLRRGVSIPFERPNTADYYVVEEVGSQKVVGMLMTTQEWSEWRAGVILWIQSVYVVPEHRRKGLFRLMYEHLKGIAMSSEEVQGIRLYVESTNETAMRTYCRLGMEEEHYRMMKWMKGGF